MLTLCLTAKCSKSQHRRLGQLFGMSAELYNALLESRKGSYEWWKWHHNPELEKFPSERILSRYDLFKMFTQVRGEDDRWAGLDTRVGRGVICRFDRARQGFYDRCSRGETPGYPRFKAARRWRSIEIPDATALMLSEPGEGGRWWRLRVKGVPRVRFADRSGRLRAALDSGGRLVELRVVRTPLRVEVHAVFRCAAVPEPVGEPSNPVGIDKGLSSRLVLSDGTHIAARDADLGEIKKRQRALSRAKKGPARGPRNTRRWPKHGAKKQRGRGTPISVSPTSSSFLMTGWLLKTSTWRECSARNCFHARSLNSGGTHSIRYWNTKPKKLVSAM